MEFRRVLFRSEADRTPRKAADARTGDDVFANLNAALARTGVTLRIVAGTDVATPLHLVFIGAPSEADRAWHLRHAVDVGEGASLVLAEHHLADGTHRHLDTADRKSTRLNSSH